MPQRVLITVAEPSGDRHAATLARSLREARPSLAIDAFGGPALSAAGANLLRDTVSNAAMGFSAVARAGEVMRMVAQLKARFDSRERPGLVVCVDSWSMNVHFARAAKAAGIPVMYFVAPQVWAWRGHRIKAMRALVDHLACILPFEEKWFADHGVRATFVGHPLFEQIDTAHPRALDYDGVRPPVVGLLPGSRRSEATANWPRMREVAARLREAFPGVRFVVPTTAATAPVVSDQPLEGAEAALDAFDRLVPQCDLVITVSGTATLHVAAHRVPMLVVYAASGLAWNAVGRWVIPTRTFALVNLLAANEPRPPQSAHIVREFIPWYGSTRPVSDHAIDLLRHPERLAEQRRVLDRLVARVGQPGAGRRAAEIALMLMK